jgi:hypothetical protein
LSRHVIHNHAAKCGLWLLTGGTGVLIVALYVLSRCRSVTCYVAGLRVWVGGGCFAVGWPASHPRGVYVSNAYPDVFWAPSLFKGSTYSQVTLPLWLGLAAILTLIAWLAIACYRPHRRRGACRICGYDIATLPHKRCPECGGQDPDVVVADQSGRGG